MFFGESNIVVDTNVRFGELLNDVDTPVKIYIIVTLCGRQYYINVNFYWSS